MKIVIEIDTKNPVAGTTISFDGVKQGRIQRVDLKLKVKGISQMVIERACVEKNAHRPEAPLSIKKVKEQIFRCQIRS